MGSRLIFLRHLIERWGDAGYKAVRTAGIVRRSRWGWVSEMLTRKALVCERFTLRGGEDSLMFCRERASKR